MSGRPPARGLHRAFVGLGANLGDPEAQVRGALRELARLGDLRASSLYRTEPVGDRTQPWYVNAVAELRTSLSPQALWEELARMERAAGRPAPRRSGESRPLDLDLLLYDDLVLESETLQIPHPRMHVRRFVLEPLAEIAADAREPRSGRTALALLGALSDPARVQRLGAGASGGGASLGRHARR